MTLEMPRDHKQVMMLEELHVKFLNARLRKRKTVTIKAEDFQLFEDALKAALPPLDLTKSSS